MANLAEKTDELLRKRAETLQQTSYQPTSPSLQQDEFDYILSQCTDAELSVYYQPNEPTNQRSTVAGEASSNYKAASSPAYSSPSHSTCATSSCFIYWRVTVTFKPWKKMLFQRIQQKIPPGQFPFGSSGALIAKSCIPVCTVNGLYTCTLPMKICLITGSVNSSSKQETRRGSRTLPTHSLCLLWSTAIYQGTQTTTQHFQPTTLRWVSQDTWQWNEEAAFTWYGC